MFIKGNKEKTVNFKEEKNFKISINRINSKYVSLNNNYASNSFNNNLNFFMSIDLFSYERHL